MNSRTKNILITSLVTFLGGILILVFLLYQINTKGSQLDTYITALSEKSAQEAAFIKIRRLVEETEHERALLTAAFFQDEGDSITFLGDIESFARKIGLSLETRDLNKLDSKNDGTEYISITFSYSGNKAQVQDFTTFLETVPYHSKVTGLFFEKEPRGTWRGNVTLNITITPS